MWKFLILIITYTTFSCYGFGQNAIVHYSVVNMNESNVERIKMLKEEVELMVFTLKYDLEYSSFIKEKYIPKDKFMSKIAPIIIGAPSNFFQFSGTSKSFFTTSIGNTNYNVDHSFKMKDWQLTTETSIIEKYTCYKAILTEYNNRTETFFETIAWFTPDIPAGYGPIGYGGLPGLILQLEFKKSVFTANKILLNPEKFKNEVIPDGAQISVQEYVKLMRASRKVTED